MSKKSPRFMEVSSALNGLLLYRFDYKTQGLFEIAHSELWKFYSTALQGFFEHADRLDFVIHGNPSSKVRR